MPTTLEVVAGYDLTQLEIKMVEDKRDATFKKKAMLTSQAVPSENEGDKNPDEEMQEQPSESEPNHLGTDEGMQTQDIPEATDATSDPATEMANVTSAAVHEGVSCDSCHVLPLIGTRYKCARFVLVLIVCCNDTQMLVN